MKVAKLAMKILLELKNYINAVPVKMKVIINIMNFILLMKMKKDILIVIKKKIKK